MELQADCYAGIWGHHIDAAENVLEEGDVEEGLQAAAAVGDDRLMSMAGRAVVREAFTHGSSEERANWLKAGLNDGSVEACNTFRQAGIR
jgi:predicted metalloprotease